MSVILTIACISITVSDNSKKLSLTDEGTNNSKDFTVSLHHVCYHKKIYQPGMVTAKIQLAETYTSSVDIITYFKNQTIRLQRDDTSKSPVQPVDVATDYYVFKVIPEFRREDLNTYCIITLFCYSRDHKLTLTPYCKTYVNKKLIGTSEDDGIIQNELTNGLLKKAGFQHIEDANTDTIDWDLRYLTYISEVNASGNETKRKEFIHPYLVQYNESFYDFLARTANRCGELVFHEDGKLHIGTPMVPFDASSVKALDKEHVLAYRYVGYEEAPVDATNVYADDADKNVLKKGEGIYAAESNAGEFYFYYNELPFDEYLGMFLKEDEFTSFEKEWVKDYWFILVDSLNIILNSSGWAQIGTKLAEKFLATSISALDDSKTKNQEKNEKWIYSADEDQKAKEKNKTIVSLYGSMLSSAQKQYNYEHQLNLNAKFYRFVDKYSRKVSQSLVEVELGVGTSTDPMPVCALGEVVAFEKKKYIVIEVKETLHDQSNTNSTPKGQMLVLAPLVDAGVMIYDSSEQTYKEASSALSVFCPPMVVPFVRTSGTQRAFVAKNGDPEGLGRICIRYPWQAANDEPSPWIRMAVPFAPNDTNNDRAGFFFEPEPGDEVLVNYEFGNIEHPFVIGSLFTHRTQAPKGDRCIESGNGHMLSFNDHDSLADFVAGIYPGYELIDNALAKIGDMKKIVLSLGDVQDNFVGGLSLNDRWGIYKISCSTTDRNISIKSPFGDVTVSAFTGISISAPNGDISIKGKNISIEAGNEVKIVSGKSINESKESVLQMVDKGVTEFVENLPVTIVEQFAPLTDFDFLRTCYEALFKPVVGNTTITAGRYLLLNAGGGKAQIPNKGFSYNGLKAKEEDNDEKIKLTNTLALLSTQIDTWLDALEVKYNGVSKAVAAYKDTFAYFEKPAAANLAEELSKAASELKDTDLKIASGSEAQDTKENKANAVMALAMVRGMILDIQNYCNDIKSGNAFDINEKDERYYAKILKEAMDNAAIDIMPEVIKSIIKKTEKFEQMPHIYIKNPANKKQLCHMLAYRLVEDSYVFGQKPDQSKGEQEVKFMTADDYLDDKKWTTFINLLAPNPTKKYFDRITDSIKDTLTENLPIVGWGDERDVWDTFKQGELLISDKDGKDTINIVNGVLTRTTNKDGFKEQVLETLRNI